MVKPHSLQKVSQKISLSRLSRSLLFNLSMYSLHLSVLSLFISLDLSEAIRYRHRPLLPPVEAKALNLSTPTQQPPHGLHLRRCHESLPPPLPMQQHLPPSPPGHNIFLHLHPHQCHHRPLAPNLRRICACDQYVRCGLWKKGDFKLTTKHGLFEEPSSISWGSSNCCGYHKSHIHSFLSWL